MRREEQWARERFAEARVGRLATASADATPRIVPIVFALADGDTILTAVDHKPKSTTRLRRLADIEANPAVSLLVDAYDDDWSQLWWARADGRAQVHETHDLAPLVEKYADYRDRPPTGPVIVIAVARWSGWSAT
ncbi:PPOX class probable F420-dependent enzyme [Nocardioides luteus]|uniref:PPOX class F420-dependent oxidoreductase n=1 Tax=Nocardioides luteus TaxID=1844 RepID=A0ABQ5T190_9ACTN|nr:TIGR03668 family PPOX class F420-dependent oxidoreductase [Nocardioides luteus]MDR7310377.1 PPOX class probable F420-dependent enzyme [Nocardioides luteus]GGR53167.1 PPOX class F420-dependent oxidoreductase [Nocardioides luteus]GLJ69844.1 PPOX class F420-dependent oxidoreductase [Nocardioides luteus]